MSAKVCETYPDGHAVGLAQSLRQCPGLKPLATTIDRAPAGSVIVYKTTRHEFGHVETKVLVTPAIARTYKKFGFREGQFIYCSDFCNKHPTLSNGTNTAIAIFGMR